MALLPIILLAIGTGLKFLDASNSSLLGVANVFSEPTWVMMICFAVAMLIFGSQKSIRYSSMMKGSEQALQDIAPILLIIAGAGALKAVFVDSGVNKLLGEYLSQIAIHPLVLGWLIATLIRICLGSATVAGLTTAGIVAPLVKSRPQLNGPQHRGGQPDVLARQRCWVLDVRGLLQSILEGYVQILDDDGNPGRNFGPSFCPAFVPVYLVLAVLAILS